MPAVASAKKTAQAVSLYDLEMGHLFLRNVLLKRMPKGSICAEIGVHKGAFSARILSVVQPRELHLIDPWKYEPGNDYKYSLYGGLMGGGQARLDARHASINKRFREQIQSGRVIVHRLPSAEAAPLFANAYFDWVYIDANHLYPFVKADLEAFAPKVKVGGFITGDDYGIRGWWQDGVTRAVNEYVAERHTSGFSVHNGQFLLAL